MSFEVRAGHENEYEEILDVTDAAFEHTPKEYFDNAWKNDPNFAPELHRVGVLDGRIVSAVRIAKKTMRVGCATVTLGGIADVSTHPDFRGRGYSTACLEDAIRFMEGNDFDLSMLFTGIHSFYRRLGWECFPTYEIIYTLRPEEIEQIGDPPAGEFVIEKFSRDRHLDGVSHVYDQSNEGLTTGTICRGVKYYGGTFWRNYDPDAFLVAVQGQDVIAYVRGKYGETARIYEYGTIEEGYVANGLEWTFRQFLKSATGRGAQRVTHVPSVEEEFWFGYRQYWSQEKIRERNHMMLRLIDLRRFIDHIRPELDSRFQNRTHLDRDSEPDRMANLAYEVGNDLIGIRWDGDHVEITDGIGARRIFSAEPVTFLQFLLADFDIPVHVHCGWGAEDLGRIRPCGTDFIWWPVDDF